MNIVFLHGHCGSKESFNFLKKDIPGLLTFDLPGFGDEKKPRASYNKDFFLKFLESKITNPSIIIGYSMGAMLAKDFALAYPSLVKKLILVEYPLQKNHTALVAAFRKDRLYRQYVDKTPLSWLLCHTHVVYKYPLILISFVLRPGQYLQTRDWFKHTYWSALSSIHDYILKDDWRTLLPLKDKTVLIIGQNDTLVDPALAKQFRHYEVPGAKHWIFDHRSSYITLIKEEL